MVRILTQTVHILIQMVLILKQNNFRGNDRTSVRICVLRSVNCNFPLVSNYVWRFFPLIEIYFYLRAGVGCRSLTPFGHLSRTQTPFGVCEAVLVTAFIPLMMFEVQPDQLSFFNEFISRRIHRNLKITSCGQNLLIV